MKLLCCGINHQTASLAVRENFALTEASLLPALQALQKNLGENEAMIISTCNRLEIYVALFPFDELVKWLADYFNTTVVELMPFLYVKYDQEVVQHAIRVASGLDSMVLGEPQILGQMKCAYAQAGELGLIGQHLGHLFPFVFAAAKKIRTETTIGQNPVSVAYAAVNLAQRIIPNIATANVLLIGAGETIESVTTYLSELNVNNMIVANRSLDRAKRLAERFNATNILIGDIPNYLANIDIIITSTASQLPLIGKGLIERIMREREIRPLFIVDIAVPRDVEPEVGEITNVYLYNIDDLQNVVEKNKEQRCQAAVKAEAMIAVELENFQQWEASLHSIPAICAYRQHVEQLRDTELQKALNALAQGRAFDQVLQDLARGLTNKLMHGPSVAMRQASSAGRNDLLQWSTQLLGIKSNESVN